MRACSGHVLGWACCSGLGMFMKCVFRMHISYVPSMYLLLLWKLLFAQNLRPRPSACLGGQRVRKRQQRQAHRRLLTHLHSNLTRRTTTWGSPLCFGQMSLMMTATR